MIAEIETDSHATTRPLLRRGAKGGPLEYVSASRVNTWLQCRRKFYYRYVLKLGSPSSPALHLGKVVHATLQDWNHGHWSGNQIEGELLLGRYREHWSTLLDSDPVIWPKPNEEEKQRSLGWGLVEHYIETCPIPADEKPAGVEVRLEAPLPGGLPNLIGIIDLVRANGSIVDYKTAARTPDEELTRFTHGLQLSLYARLYRECTGKREEGLELHHLIKTKAPKVEVHRYGTVGDQEMENTLQTLHRFVDAVEAEDWTASPNFMCGSCEFYENCKARLSLVDSRAEEAKS